MQDVICAQTPTVYTHYITHCFILHDNEAWANIGDHKVVIKLEVLAKKYPNNTCGGNRWDGGDNYMSRTRKYWYPAFCHALRCKWQMLHMNNRKQRKKHITDAETHTTTIGPKSCQLPEIDLKMLFKKKLFWGKIVFYFESELVSSKKRTTITDFLVNYHYSGSFF